VAVAAAADERTMKDSHTRRLTTLAGEHNAEYCMRDHSPVPQRTDLMLFGDKSFKETRGVQPAKMSQSDVRLQVH